MFKKTIFKLSSLTLIAMLSLCSLGMATPSTIMNDSKVKKVATDYLNSIVNKDVDNILNLSKEENLISDEMRKEDVITTLQNPNFTIKDFDIIDIYKIDNNLSNVKCRMYYTNGAITEETLNLKNIDNEIYVYLKDIEEDTTKTIKEGSSLPVKSPRVMLTSWNVTLTSDGQDTKYSPVFSTNSDYIHINFRQSATMQYAVYQKVWYGNKKVSWMTEQTMDNWTTGPDNVYINKIPGESYQNCRLRIYCPSGNGASFGEIYVY